MRWQPVRAVVMAPILLIAATAAATTGASTGASVDLPTSIDATGSRDVTQELNVFLARVPRGTTVSFPVGGRFRSEGIVVVGERHDVTIDGNGSTIIATTDGSGVPVPFYNYRAHWPRMRDHFEIRDSTGVTVRDLTVEGPNRDGTFVPALEAQAGFVVSRSRDVTLDGVTARATYGDGVYIVGAAEDVTVSDCTLDRNGRQGVAVVAGERIVVEGCTIRDTGRSAIDLEPAHGFVRTVHIRDNRVMRTTNFLLAAVGAGVGVQDVWLEHNTVVGGRGVSVYVGTERSIRPGIHVLDNSGDGVSAGYQSVLMRFTRFDGIEVKGNRQRVANGVTPVLLVNSCNEVVQGNDFAGAGETVKRSGDCATPIPQPSSTTRGQPAPPASGSGPTSTPAAAPVAAGSTTEGTSPLVVAIAVGAGVLAGIAGTLLVVAIRARQRR